MNSKLSYYRDDENTKSSRAEKLIAILIGLCAVLIAYLFIVVVYETYVTERLPTADNEEASRIQDQYLPDLKLVMPSAYSEVFNYTETVGELNITIYYDEPKMTEQEWQELEEEDEENHKEWAEENE